MMITRQLLRNRNLLKIKQNFAKKKPTKHLNLSTSNLFKSFKFNGRTTAFARNPYCLPNTIIVNWS